MKRANVGSGVDPVEGWDCFDVLGGGRGQVPQWDVRTRLRGHAGHYDYAVAHHVLTALDHHELPGALANIRNILRPGGVLRVSVPDLHGGFVALDGDDVSWFPQDHQIEGINARFCTWVTWFGTHRSVFTGRYLEDLLIDAKFTVRFARYRETHTDHLEIVELDSRPTESLFVEATKPA